MFILIMAEPVPNQQITDMLPGTPLSLEQPYYHTPHHSTVIILRVQPPRSVTLQDIHFDPGEESTERKYSQPVGTPLCI